MDLRMLVFCVFLFSDDDCDWLFVQERERLQEMQMARDQEEQRLRQEARQRNDDYVTQQMLQQRQQRQHQNRDIRVSDERQRLENLSRNQGPASPNANPGVNAPGNISHSSQSNNNNHINGMSNNNNKYNGQGQYMNLPPAATTPEKENQAPPPPERKSSYNTAARNNLDFNSSGSFNNNSGSYNNNSGFNNNQGQDAPSHLPPALKKSVKFNTDMNTYQDRTPSHSFSSEHNMSPLNEQPPQGANDVFSAQSPTSPNQQTPPSYSRSPSTSSNTPTVIGAQEIYRDPRSRIEAQRATQPRKPAADRLSFRDKMKFFAQEAGEDTPKNKPKASKTLRHIESQLNGQW